MSLLEIEFYNLFWFVLFGGYFDLKTQIQNLKSWPELIQYVVISIFFFKKYHLEFFWVKLYFYQSSKLFWTH
jgi:hypothetical protein